MQYSRRMHPGTPTHDRPAERLPSGAATAVIRRELCLLGPMLLALVLLAVLAPVARADIYWGDREFPGEVDSYFGHARLDGSEVNSKFLPAGKEVEDGGIAADANYLYAAFPNNGQGSIGRARLNGTEATPTFIYGPDKTPIDDVDGIAVNAHYVFWSEGGEGEPDAIGRGPITGGEGEPDFITFPDQEKEAPQTIALQGEYLYWISADDAIGRANVNTKEVDPEFVPAEEDKKSTLGDDPEAIAVDSGHIYWRDFAENEELKQITANIGRANIDGTEPEKEWMSNVEEGLGFPQQGLAVDANHIYWSTNSTETSTIARADIDGGGEERDFISSFGIVHGITLDHRITIDSTADLPDEKEALEEGYCEAKGHVCTLRAAIEAVNVSKTTFPTPVGVEIPGGKLETVKLKTELPKIEHPIELDARGQPGALEAGKRKIGLIVDGAGLSGSKANGLELGPEAKGSTIAGVQIQHFSGDGVLLEGESEQLADSVLAFDNSGVEVAANNDTVGYGNGLPGDIFYHDGLTGLVKLMEEKKKFTPSEFEGIADVLGEDIRLSKPSSGTRIEGNDIGVHGKPFEEAPDELGPDGFTEKWSLGQGFPIGIMIAPATATTAISNVTIGGAGEAANVISGNLFGIMAFGAENTPASNIAILGNSFGDNTEGSPLEPLGNVMGILAGGPISGLQIGRAGEGNKFQGDLVGTLAGGTQLSGLTVQGNTFGKSLALGNVGKGLAGHEGFGVLLGDAQGARIGGSGAGEGNSFPGTIIGIGMLGKHLANDEIVGNTIGSVPAKPFTTFANLPEEYSTIFGILVVPSTSASVPNLTITGNTIQGTLLGSLQVGIKGLTMTRNTIENDVFGVFDVGSGGEQIGRPGEGNSFLNDGVGLLDGNTNPTPQEDEQATVNPKDSENKTREEFLSTPDSNLADNVVDDLTTAELSPTSANTTAAPGEANSIMGNRFGVNSSGVAQPDELPVLIFGDEHGLQFGGTGSGQGNVVEDNRSGGVLIAGTLEHNPSVQVLGNTIYNNENFNGTAPIPGLGINLFGEVGNGVGVVGVDPQDPTQPDGGPNASQNSPLLSAASVESESLTVTGSLHGVANTNYLIEVFADENANPFGAGEGETHLGTLELATEGSGNVAFTATFADPGTAYRFVSATATTVPGGGTPGVTSEFSVDQPISRPGGSTTGSTSTNTSGSTSTGTGTGTAPGASTGTSKGAASTTVNSSGATATTSGSSVTLPVQASCSSATTTPCTVTTTATTAASGAGKASVAAVLAKTNKPVTIGHGTITLAAGASGPLHLILSKQGLALLRAHRALAITLAIEISGQGRATVTRTVHLELRYKAKSKRPSKKTRH